MHSPKTANTLDKVCSLKRDNIDLGDHWCLVDETTVTICRQRSGEQDMITLTKREFNRIVKFYTTPTKGHA